MRDYTHIPDDTDLPSPLSLIFSLKPFFGDLAASASLRVEQEQRRAQEGFLPRERGESVGGRGEEREKEGEQQRSKDLKGGEKKEKSSVSSRERKGKPVGPAWAMAEFGV